MKPLPEDMAREIGAHLREAEKLLSVATGLIAAPAGHPPERLEDTLNALQDETFKARRAFRVASVRDAR